MPRPKGSKNRKSISTVASMHEQIENQEKVVAAIQSEIAELADAIKVQQGQLKAKKKDLRKAEKSLAALRAKQEEAEAIESAAAAKAEIEKVVATLIESGKTADEILSKIQD